MNSTLSKVCAAILVTASFAACKKETVTQTVTVNNPVYNLRGSLSAKQEVPTNTSTATGTVTGTYDKDKNLLTYTVTWTGLTGNPSAGHFHGAADPGSNAGIKVPFTGLAATPAGTFSGTSTLSDADETDFLNGLWYCNIHTPTYGGGEIRAQVFLTQ